MKTKLLTLAMVLFIAGTALSQRTLNTENIKEISGIVTEVNHPVAKISGDDGTLYELRMGPFWYWSKNNLSLSANSAIVIRGEVKNLNGINQIYPYDLTQNGTKIVLANDNGTPKWLKGKGIRNGRGNNCFRNGRGNKGNNDNWNGRGNGRGYGRGYGRGNNPNCPYINK